MMIRMSRLSSFVAECQSEFAHINWPSRRETVRMTAVVILLSAGIAAFLGAADFAFLYALNSYLNG